MLPQEEGLPKETYNLTPLQSRFIDEYLVDLNATQAALRTGFSAGSYGRELITKTYIKAEVKRRMILSAGRTGVSVTSVVNELAILYRKALDTNELSTCTRVLELLGRHVGAFEKDNKQKGGKVVVNMNFTRPDNPQVQAIIDVEPIKAIE